MQPHVQDKQKEVANKKGLFLQVNFSLFHQSPLWFSFYHYWFLSYLSWPFYTLFQNELREGSNEDEDDDEDEFNHVQDRHAEYSSNGHQIQLHITSDSQDEEHPTYTNLTNADNDTNDANESLYRRSYEWKRKQCWSIFDHEIILSRGHSINFVNHRRNVTLLNSNHFGIHFIWNIAIHVHSCHFMSFCVIWNHYISFCIKL